METLLTAIAIIKQSRVYEDECCQALVTSLKDCLMSIQENCGHRFVLCVHQITMHVVVHRESEAEDGTSISCYYFLTVSYYSDIHNSQQEQKSF